MQRWWNSLQRIHKWVLLLSSWTFKNEDHRRWGDLIVTNVSCESLHSFKIEFITFCGVKPQLLIKWPGHERIVSYFRKYGMWLNTSQWKSDEGRSNILEFHHLHGRWTKAEKLQPKASINGLKIENSRGKKTYLHNNESIVLTIFAVI